MSERATRNEGADLEADGADESSPSSVEASSVRGAEAEGPDSGTRSQSSSGQPAASAGEPSPPADAGEPLSPASDGAAAMGPDPAPSGDVPSEPGSGPAAAATSGEAFAVTWPASDSNWGSAPRPSRPSTPSASTENVADPLIGWVVAERYRIKNQLGRGGMGIVYRVEHTRIGKLLAMKLLHGELSTNKEVVRRFKHEALTVSKLSSPHTVQVFDYGVWQNLTYLVMELVEGPTLARILRRGGPMPFSQVGKLMVQVCSSLAEAHGKGIVHRDIKPENIMVLTDEHGVELAKVLDFGLAKLRESSELNEVTSQGAVVGTPYFISPEQVLGEEVDGRTDIYSLGAVMFRVLTGTYPFNASTPMGMFTKHLTQAPPSAAKRAPDIGIPKGVSRLVKRCMAKKPEDRFRSIERVRDELLRELRALGLSGHEGIYLPDDGDLPPPSTRPPDSQRPLRGRKGRRGSQVATRDEVEAYERKLMRAKWGTRAVIVALLLGGGAAAGTAVKMQPSEFTGVELERNDLAAQANPLPLGSTMEGMVGRRLDDATGDRDFFSFDVPAPAGGDQFLSVRLSSLPNMAMTAIFYREGFQQPLARFRTGRPAADLEVSTLRVEPGRYFIAVMQDLDRHGRAQAPLIHENVSDPYQLTLELVLPSEGDEIEPNDQVQSAQAVAVGQRVVGTLAWADDQDVLCASEATGTTVRWRVEDEGRISGTILQVTPLTGGETGPLVRVHAEKAQRFERPRLPADVNSPWVSPTFTPGEAGRCLRLELTIDPWADRRGGERPQPDTTQYAVTLEQLP